MRENRSSGFPTMSDTNWPIQSQKKIRILKFWEEVEEELYIYGEADLRLCFHIGKNPVFS